MFLPAIRLAMDIRLELVEVQVLQLNTIRRSQLEAILVLSGVNLQFGLLAMMRTKDLAKMTVLQFPIEGMWSRPLHVNLSGNNLLLEQLGRRLPDQIPMMKERRSRTLKEELEFLLIDLPWLSQLLLPTNPAKNPKRNALSVKETTKKNSPWFREDDLGLNLS
jgi:hypothetical protein